MFLENLYKSKGLAFKTIKSQKRLPVFDEMGQQDQSLVGQNP